MEVWRERGEGVERDGEGWRMEGDGEGKDGERGEGTVIHGMIDMFTVNWFSVTNYSRGEKPSTHKQYIHEYCHGNQRPGYC